ncbi:MULTISPECIES: hypothetical protein [unclassified Mesorhizobium]|uniref:hypothetical protein n=1 Tax=unclassified Mesorhizobium TaxID=325217 RepID=UPI0016736119|nr:MULTISPECIES: hypothetical protein [unclassified Mesorhizobium]
MTPGNGNSIHLPGFDGVIYYTVEQAGYRVVATLASGADELPIRFISTLGQGQRIVISVPQTIGQPAIEFEILRNGDALVVSDPIAAATIDSMDEVATPAALAQ